MCVNKIASIQKEITHVNVTARTGCWAPHVWVWHLNFNDIYFCHTEMPFAKVRTIITSFLFKK